MNFLQSNLMRMYGLTLMAALLCIGCGFNGTSKNRDNTSSNAGNAIKPEAVDLGLSVKWSSCNLGATSDYDLGPLFTWGDTDCFDEITHNYYKFYEYKTDTLHDNRMNKILGGAIAGIEHFILTKEVDNAVEIAAGEMFSDLDTYSTTVLLTKYCTDETYGIRDNKRQLEKIDDAAYCILGKHWRIPTKKEVDELINLCSWSYVELEGNHGYMIIGPNDKWIFLPLPERKGIREPTSIFWTATLADDSNNAYALCCSKRDIGVSSLQRIIAATIRPVYE